MQIVIQLDWVGLDSSCLSFTPQGHHCPSSLDADNFSGRTKYPVRESEKGTSSVDTWTSPLIEANTRQYRSQYSRMGRDREGREL